MSKKNPFVDLESLRREDNMGGQRFVQEVAELEQEVPNPRTKWRREFVLVPWDGPNGCRRQSESVAGALRSCSFMSIGALVEAILRCPTFWRGISDYHAGQRAEASMNLRI
jgi:hypothetical protein